MSRLEQILQERKDLINHICVSAQKLSKKAKKQRLKESGELVARVAADEQGYSNGGTSSKE